MSRRGHLIWAPLVVVYWGIAFVVGSAIPSVGTLSGLVAAACIFQFSYTFPPALMLGYMMHEDAMVLDEPFTTPGVAPRRRDTWTSMVSCDRVRLESSSLGLTLAFSPSPDGRAVLLEVVQSAWYTSEFGFRNLTVAPHTDMPFVHRSLLFLWFLAALATAGLGLWASKS